MANANLSTPSFSGITLSASTTDDSFNDSASGLADFDGYAWINVSGFTDSSNNGIFAVEAVTAAKITVVENLVTEIAGDSVTVYPALPTIWPNDIVTTVPNNQKHVYLRIEINDRENIEFGSTMRDRIHGELVARVRTPATLGDQAALALVDDIMAAFQHVTDTSCKFNTPRYVPIGTIGAFYEINVFCPFWYDETS